MVDKISPSAKVEVLISRQNQEFEQIRHMQRLITSIQTIFLPISYGILAYTIGKEIDYQDLIIAFIASTLIYLFQIFMCERLTAMIDITWDHVDGIQKKLDDIVDISSECSEDFDQRFSKKIEAYRDKYKGIGFGFYGKVIFLSGFVKIREMRVIMMLALVVLWLFRLV